MLCTRTFLDIAKKMTYAKSIRTKRTVSLRGSGAAVSLYNENLPLYFFTMLRNSSMQH